MLRTLGREFGRWPNRFDVAFHYRGDISIPGILSPWNRGNYIGEGRRRWRPEERGRWPYILLRKVVREKDGDFSYKKKPAE